MRAGSAVSSASTTSSLGPASMSMLTRPATCCLAAVTQRLPGPTMQSTAGTAPAPNASAAMAWAPPTVSTASAPATWAAARVIGAGRGEATQTSETPAARAVTAVISTLEGRG